MTTLPDRLFSGLSALTILNIGGNAFRSLPAGVFSGLSKLRELYLDGNQLSALPDGLFSGLTALTYLTLGDNPGNPMPLTVTLEKVGTDRMRAKVLAGAPRARTPSWTTTSWARSPATWWTARGRVERTPIPSSPTPTRISIPARGTTPRSMRSNVPTCGDCRRAYGMTVVTRNVADFGPLGVETLNPWK